MFESLETRRLLSFRKNAPACSDISFHLQFSGPGTQSIRPKLRQQIAPSFRFRPIVGGKIFHRFAVGKVESIPASNEKFPPCRRLPVANHHATATRGCDFCGPQACRTSADRNKRFPTHNFVSLIAVGDATTTAGGPLQPNDSLGQSYFRTIETSERTAVKV